MGIRFGLVFAVALIAVCVVLPRQAGAMELRYDSGTADDFTFQLTDGYLVRFTPPEFENPVIVDVSFFGNRYGQIDPKESPVGYLAILDKDLNKLTGRNVPFSDLSTSPSWNHINLDPYVIKDAFWVYLYFPSNSARGVMMGKDMNPSSLKSRIGNASEGFKAITDGKYNWMIRCEVTDGLEVQQKYSSADLTGANFLYKDSGVASGFQTLYKNSATIAFDLAQPAVIDKLYIYGRATGDWMNSDREFSVYLLDQDMRIQMTKSYPLRLFTSTAEWLRIDLPDTKLSGHLLLIIEPNSRDEVGLELGYDQEPNKGSDVTNMGQPADWPFNLDKNAFNWMFRLETK